MSKSKNFPELDALEAIDKQAQEKRRNLAYQKNTKSLFQRAISPKFGYQVPIEVRLSNGNSSTIVKYVMAWSKSRAKKQALALCLKDVKFITGKITRVKKTRKIR